jgi:hypothetical protein
MSHFAKVLDGKVIQVIVAEPEFFDTFVDTSAGTWLQTSYNTHGNKHPENKPLRGNYAGVGFVYDHQNDVFYEPQPFPSWILNKDTWLWESPSPHPEDGKAYRWDEPSLSWKELVI